VAGQLDSAAGTATATKAALRREILAARDALTADARAEASAKITAQLLALDAWVNARCVLVYLTFGSEFITKALLENAAASGKQLCLPRVDRAARQLAIHAVADTAADVQAGVWGIREPRPNCPLVALEAIDFVLVPGVAFTRRCERLGYGGGFYDRLIARFEMRPPLVAAAYALQMHDQIPLSATDRQVDLVITEDHSYCGC
jgi:5-formyltetrahydrofolate cyclo-ligase